MRAVVVARHGADDTVERGDDEDDAGRCRSDARARTRAALAAAERLRVTVDADGADIARGGFPNRPFLSLTKMKVAHNVNEHAPYVCGARDIAFPSSNNIIQKTRWSQ